MTILAPFLLIGLTACEESVVSEPVSPVSFHSNGLFVLNEGLWGQNNSTLMWIDLFTGSRYESVSGNSAPADAGWILSTRFGDTGNHLSTHGDTTVVVMSGSNALILFSPQSGRVHRTIRFSQSVVPRQAVYAGNSTWWVSSFYRHSVLLVDGNSGTILTEIPVHSYPEQLLVADGWLWISCTGLGSGNTVVRFRLTDPSDRQDIPVGLNPAALIPVTGRIYVHLLDDSWATTPDSRLIGMDAVTGLVVDSIRVGSPIRLVTRRDETTLLVITSLHLLQLDLVTRQTRILRTFSDQPLAGRIPYKIGYDSRREIAWISSLNDYTQSGWVEGFNQGDRFYGPFPVGRNPGSLLWNY